MKQSEDRIKTSNIDEDLFGEDANKESPPFVLYMRSERPTEEGEKNGQK